MGEKLVVLNLVFLVGSLICSVMLAITDASLGKIMVSCTSNLVCLTGFIMALIGARG